MATAFLSGLNRARYGVLLNELHNAFRTGRDEYPNTLIAAYDSDINWKGYTKGASVTPNNGVAFTADSEEVYVHATDGMKLTRTGKPVICHIYGKNRYTNRCPDREESAPEKKADNAVKNPKKEIPPTNTSVNLTIG